MTKGLVLAAAIAALVAGAAFAGTEPASRRAVALLASVKGPVSVDRGAGGTSGGQIGLRLLPGDVVRVAAGGSATVYLAGGTLVRVAAEGRFSVPAEARTEPLPSAGRLSDASVRVSEPGLWMLDDPEGTHLALAMRGDEELWAGSGDEPAAALSPRYEVVTAATPRFVASGGPSLRRISVATGKKVVWTSRPLEGPGPWRPEGFPVLDPKTPHAWRLEGADGTPLTEWVPFRVGSPESIANARAFEAEMATLATEAGGPTAADLLRCGFYLKAGSWTSLLAAAERLLAESPEAEAAKNARARAARGLRLDDERIGRLAAAVR